jgi:hypothetical protein
MKSKSCQVLPSQHYHFISVLKPPENPIVLLALVNGAFYRYLFKNQCSNMDLNAVHPKMLYGIYAIMDGKSLRVCVRCLSAQLGQYLI